jgi:hypothetical protein
MSGWRDISIPVIELPEECPDDCNDHCEICLKNWYSNIRYLCPECLNPNIYDYEGYEDDRRTYYNYCPRCGQKLKWGR